MARKEWLTPAEAAEEMSKVAGYQITVADIRQMRLKNRLTSLKKLNKRITLYDKEEIQRVRPVRKRPVEGEASQA
jgi:hypothetical protein